MLIFKKYKFINFSVLLIPIISLFFITTQLTTSASELGDDFSTDSEIELKIIASESDVNYYNIKFTTLSGKTTMTVIKDDKKTQTEIPYTVCENLWNYLIKNDVGYLDDAYYVNPLPDIPSIKIKVRVSSDTHIINTDAVDFLADTRYGDIVREIIRVSEENLPSENN